MNTASTRKPFPERDPSLVPSSDPVDVLSREQLGQALKALDVRYRRFLESMHEMRFVVSEDGSLMDVNQAGVELFGFVNRDEMVASGGFERLFRHPEALEALRSVVREDGFVREFASTMRRKDGSCFDAAITAYLWSEGDASFSYEGLLRDVSREQQWETERIELERHNRLLQESEERCRRLNEHIVHMLLVLAHDIRGPLVSMAATLKLLIRGTYGQMDESVQNTVRDLFTRTKRLIGLAEDHLGGAHCDNGPIQSKFEMLDLREDIIDPVLDEISSDIALRGVTIDSRLGAIPVGRVSVKLSRVWLKAVFRNLFMNALKYGEKGGRIAFGFQDHETHYRLNVYNSGHPIPPERRGELFTRFGRLQDGGEPQSEGVGLGLYLIREIIRKHGGDIWYEAKSDGSDFVFTLLKEPADPDGSGLDNTVECIE